jgi:hypothetical protein
MTPVSGIPSDHTLVPMSFPIISEDGKKLCYYFSFLSMNGQGPIIKKTDAEYRATSGAYIYDIQEDGSVKLAKKIALPMDYKIWNGKDGEESNDGVQYVIADTTLENGKLTVLCNAFGDPSGSFNQVVLEIDLETLAYKVITNETKEIQLEN